MVRVDQMTGDETIAAISTPLGEGGIGIVRISGNDSFTIAGKVFQPARRRGNNYPRSHYLYYGHIYNEHREILDEVLVSFMRAPHTYTREDIVEINCHSGVFTLRMVLKQVLKAGARLAEPGEFTRRAYINGRIDLSQAESVLKVIRARSEAGVKLAALNAQGSLSQKTGMLRGEITAARAMIEATLDFPEDIEAAPGLNDEIRQVLLPVQGALAEMVEGAERTRVFQEGIKTAIVGKPNVGKSSLLNALLGQQRAIVHEIPGTTRDLLEGYLLLEGYPLQLIDTAGIHGTEDPIEQEGIARSRAAAGEARLLLIVLDGSSPWDDHDEAIAGMAEKDQLTILIINKTDLPQRISASQLRERFSGATLIKTAVLKGKGLRRLEEAMVALLDQYCGKAVESSLLVSLRHETIARESLQYLERAIAALDTQPLELVSLELQGAWRKLGEITGETVTDDLLDRIFSEFCLGK